MGKTQSKGNLPPSTKDDQEHYCVDTSTSMSNFVSTATSAVSENLLKALEHQKTDNDNTHSSPSVKDRKVFGPSNRFLKKDSSCQIPKQCKSVPSFASTDYNDSFPNNSRKASNLRLETPHAQPQPSLNVISSPKSIVLKTKPSKRIKVFNLDLQQQDKEREEFLFEEEEIDSNNNVMLQEVPSKLDQECLLLPKRSFKKDDQVILTTTVGPGANAGVSKRPSTYTKFIATPENSKETIKTAKSNQSQMKGSSKKKLVVRGLRNFVSTRGGASHPPSWLRDFPIKSKFHPDHYLYDWDEGPKTLRKPGDGDNNSNSFSMKSARCGSCGVYSESSCRCCKKCPLDCECPKLPNQIPDVLGQAFGPGWNQAQRVICELTRDDLRAPVGGSRAKMKYTFPPPSPAKDPFKSSINVLNPNSCDVNYAHQNYPNIPNPAVQPQPYCPTPYGSNCYPSYHCSYPPPPPMYPSYFPQAMPPFMPYPTPAYPNPYQ